MEQMTRGRLDTYLANKRLINRNEAKIEEEKRKDVPEVMGVVKGSSHEFPYIKQNFTVVMDEPVKADRISKRITRLKQEIMQAEKEMEEIENFIFQIKNTRDKEILTYRYIDGMKIKDIAGKTGYTHSRVSQIISKYIKD